MGCIMKNNKNRLIYFIEKRIEDLKTKRGLSKDHLVSNTQYKKDRSLLEASILAYGDILNNVDNILE